MARRTVVHLVDDLDGTEIDDGQTVSFAHQGVAYEIDLGSANARKLHDALAPFVAAGRRTGGRRIPDPAPAPNGTAGTNGSTAKNGSASRNGSAEREQLQAIREWGRQNGFTVNDRGRLGKDLHEAYHAAH